MFDMASIDQPDIEAVGLENLEDRNPIAPCALHRNRFDAAGMEPSSHVLQVCGEGAEPPNAHLGLVVRDRGVKLSSDGNGLADTKNLLNGMDVVCVLTNRWRIGP